MIRKNSLPFSSAAQTSSTLPAADQSEDTQLRALFGISSLGLGHATRSLVVIREYLRLGYAVTVISTGNALAFLRLELAGEPMVEFREMADYPPLERGSGWRLYGYLLVDLFRTWRMIRREHRQIQAIAPTYDFIFSDGKYGFYCRQVPSVILSHQIAFVPPKCLNAASRLTEHVNILALKKFDMLLIPDYAGDKLNLAGKLSHSRVLCRCRHRYIGVLSSYRHSGEQQDIDFLFVISGYLLEHKESFVRNLLEEATDLPGKKVFMLGNAGSDETEYQRYQCENLRIHAVAAGQMRQNLFNRAHVVISRAGYTTIMDLVEHNKRALIIPTPNQTEQEYLATYLARQNYYVTRTQRDRFDLSQALQECEQTKPFKAPWKTDQSLRYITSCIESLTCRRFISIIVPAHNEEANIAVTLHHLLTQSYPKDRYEIILAENGSTDATLEIAREIAGRNTNRQLRIESLPTAGVSQAKNRGLDKLARKSEWVVFCDADTRLERNFLAQLNAWLSQHRNEDLSVGTTGVRPDTSCGWYGRCWFRAYDFIHRITRTSFSIQIAQTRIARTVRFPEDLNLSEDLYFIKQCRRHGRFFFIPSAQVSTSTRRFDSYGYLRLSLRWTYEALLPMPFRRNRKYDVIR